MNTDLNLWSETEASERAGLSKRYLQNLRQTGTGPGFYKIGKAVRYDAEEFRSWLATKYRRSTSDPGIRRGAS
jgi:predicted DNA-binding transcriptional regulator AlpA